MAKVESIAKFSFVADGKVYRYDEVTVDKATIIPGAELDLSGGKAIATMAAPANASEAVDTERAKRFKPLYEKKADAPTSGGMSKDEWAQKDRRISRQGCIQVAVQVMSDFDQASELADKMLNYVNEVK